jgi:hypothetical protein
MMLSLDVRSTGTSSHITRGSQPPLRGSIVECESKRRFKLKIK